MPLTPEGKELLLKAKEQILLNPDRYDQDRISYVNACGTVCCIAGWVDVMRFGLEKHNERVSDKVANIWNDSAEAMGLDYHYDDQFSDETEASHLFAEPEYHSDRQFAEEYWNAVDGSQRAQAAGRMIDRFIAAHS